MSVNYNNTKSMKGAAVGTIISWTGPLSAIPAGWLLCNGQFINEDDYPLLFSSIGTTYGSGVGVFRLPQIGARALADMKTSYFPSGTSAEFLNLIGTDTSNNNSNNYTSNIDLNVNIDNNISSGAGYTGILSSITATNPAFFSSFKIAERKLGDLHLATHTHEGEYSTVSKLNSPTIESCQGQFSNPFFTGCSDIFQSSDCCANVAHYLVELNWTANQVNAIYKNSILGGYPLGGSGNTSSFAAAQAGGSASPVPTINSPPRVNTPPKNWLGNSDDTILKSEVNFNGALRTLNWPTTLSGEYTTWTGSGTAQLTGHAHADINYTINVGNFSIGMPVTVDDIGPGNVAPVNTTGNTEILQMEVDVASPSLTTTYIIKAF